MAERQSSEGYRPSDGYLEVHYIPRQLNPYRIEFDDDSYGVVRAVVGERIAPLMREEREIPKVFTSLATRDEPSVRFGRRSDVEWFANELRSYAERTDEAGNDILMDWPDQVVPAVQEFRQQRAQLAAELAGKILVQCDAVESAIIISLTTGTELEPYTFEDLP